MDLKKEIDILAHQRKVFHSEADFQFALVWQIQKDYPEANVRLEYCHKDFPNMHIDIYLEIEGKCIPIELKYKTNKFAIEVDNEYFNLKKHGATDLGRYDFFVDVQRIELLKNKLTNYNKGFVVFLTNEHAYWKVPKSKKETACHNFRIHEYKICSGNLKWRNNPSIGAIKGRENLIQLESEYVIKWYKYSNIVGIKNSDFKYIILEI